MQYKCPPRHWKRLPNTLPPALGRVNCPWLRPTRHKELKHQFRLEWIKAMNSIVSRAEEIIRSEIINAFKGFNPSANALERKHKYHGEACYVDKPSFSRLCAIKSGISPKIVMPLWKSSIPYDKIYYRNTYTFMIALSISI